MNWDSGQVLKSTGTVTALMIGAAIALMPVLVHAAGKDMTKQAEKFRKEGASAREAIEDARDQLQKTVESYDALLNADEKKLASSHKKLASEIGKMEKVVESGRKDLTSFNEMAEVFFGAWETALGDISTESIKAASEKRLQGARGVFKNMSDNLTAAGEAYRPMIASLSEQATLVAQDLSMETVAILKKEAAPDIHTGAAQVLESIEKSLSKEQSSEAAMDTILAEESTESVDGAEMMVADDPDAAGDTVSDDES